MRAASRKRRLLGARDQHQPRALGIGQRIHGGFVLGALLFQSGQRAKARRIAFAFFEEAAPGAGQLQQPDGVPGRRGIENDVVVVGGQRPSRSAAP